MIRLMLVDDHALIRRGMRDAISQESDLAVVAEAAGQEELLAHLAGTPCDVLVLDINLPGPSGLDILETLQRLPQAPRALVVSMYPEDPYGVKSLRAGAWGYLNKSADSGILVEAIRTVAAGRKYIPASMAALLVENLAAPPANLAHERLSSLEHRTLMLIAQGHKLQDVADQLALTPKTVSVYRARVLEKLKLSSNMELAHYARLHGLVD